MRARVPPKNMTAPGPPWVLDIGCGCGGMSQGFKTAGFQVAGIDTDSNAVICYRHHVGVAVLQSVEEYRASKRVSTVICDLPFSAAGKTASPFAPSLPTGPGSFVDHVLRVARESYADAVVLSWYFIHQRKPGAVEAALMEAVTKAGFRPFIRQMDAADYGVPQHRHKLVVVGVRTFRMAETWRWPKKQPQITVEDVLRIPYPMPSPPLTSSEHLSSWVGYRGGKQKPRRASEIIASHVGRGLWTTLNPGCVGLKPPVLSVLQGMPLTWKWGKTITEQRLIGQAFPPPMAYAIALRIRQSLIHDGRPFALPPPV